MDGLSYEWLWQFLELLLLLLEEFGKGTKSFFIT